MKKLVLLLAFIVVTLFSCKKEEPIINNHCLFGKWKLYAVSGGFDDDSGEIYLVNENIYLTLHKNFTYKEEWPNQIIEDNFEINNDTLILYNQTTGTGYKYLLDNGNLALYRIEAAWARSNYYYKPSN